MEGFDGNLASERTDNRTRSVPGNDPETRPTNPGGGKVLIRPRIKIEQHTCQSWRNKPSSRQISATVVPDPLTPQNPPIITGGFKPRGPHQRMYSAPQIKLVATKVTVDPSRSRPPGGTIIGRFCWIV